MPRAFSSTATFRLAAVAAVVLASLGAGYVFFGQREATSEPQAAETATAMATPIRPSYLVSVREPTAEEMVQRKALSEVKPVQRPVELAPQLPTTETELTALATVLSDVNVRSGPGTASAVISVANTGIKVEVVGKEGGWTHVTLPDGGGDGWIASKFLEE